MLKNYFILTLRNLWKNKVFSAINIAGLSMGMAVCITIVLFVRYEKSFDSLHSKNIYRLNEVQSPEGMAAPQNVALSMYPMGPTLKSDFPEVKDFVRISPFEMAGLAYGDKKVFFDNMFWADPSFFSIFNFKLLKGDPSTVLSEKNTVVLTTESAKKLFGDEDPIGKSLSTHNRSDTLHFTVTGVMENVAKNSHLQFNGLISMSSIVDPNDQENWRSSWGGNWLITYLELADHTNTADMEKKFPTYLKKYMNDEAPKSLQLFLQPLKEVHGTSGNITHDYHNFQKFDQEITNLFLTIALIVLVIACANFVNLSTAKSSGRAKEVGVRKSIGAHRLQLTSQFMFESVFISAIAGLIALCVVKLSLPLVNQLSDHELVFSPFEQPFLFLWIFVCTLLVGLLSGIYPALYLSSFVAVKVLKGVSENGRNKGLTRNTLVVTQFAGAVMLIIITIFVVMQLNFLSHKDPGFNKDQVVIIPGSGKGYRQLKEELQKSPLVKMVSGSNQTLGNNLHQTGFNYRGDGPARNLVTSHVVVDDDFISLYGIPLVAGKNFSRDGSGKEFIINESLARELLKDKPGEAVETLVGDHLGGAYFNSGNDSMATIVGVVKDFNFNSLHNKIENLCLANFSDRGFYNISVKIDGKNVKASLDYIETTYKQNVTSYPYTYTFLDDDFEKLYLNEEKISKVVSVLGILSIIIASLGLLGLALQSSQSRIKEIGVRKVLGASVANIITLLSVDFMKLVLLANVIAWPVAWYLVNLWLRDYAYHVDMSWWVFALAGLLSFLIALSSVGSQTLRAATSNPVKSLRTE